MHKTEQQNREEKQMTKKGMKKELYGAIIYQFLKCECRDKQRIKILTPYGIQIKMKKLWRRAYVVEIFSMKDSQILYCSSIALKLRHEAKLSISCFVKEVY